jgi:hypothetical protein
MTKQLKNMIQYPHMNLAIVLTNLSLLSFVASGAEPHKDDFQRGIYEQEINHNTNAAILAYEKVVQDFDTQKAIVKDALSRLADLQSRNGNDGQARTIQERLASEFSNSSGSASFLSTNKQLATSAGISSRAALPDRPTMDAQTYESRQQILAQLKKETGAKRRIFAVQTGYGDLRPQMDSINQIEAKLADRTSGHNGPETLMKEQERLKNAEDQMDLHVDAMIKILEIRQAVEKPAWSEAKVLFFGAGARGNSLTIPAGKSITISQGVYEVGVGEFANLHKVKLYRKSKEGKVEVTTFDMDAIRDKGTLDEPLRDGDRVEIPERHLVF